MSGHSKWHTIKHKKGALDAKRGKLFTRLIKEMTVAARNGGGDINMNPRLRTVVTEAKAANMPAENIKRAIQRGTGELPGVTYEEINYEGYGPGGAAIIIETMTDNKNRTVGEIRHMLAKYNGNLGAENSVAWMFSKKGYMVVEKPGVDEEKLLNAVLEAGADDLRDDGDNWEVITEPVGLRGREGRGQGAGRRAGHRQGVDAAAELHQARGQGRLADAQADGSGGRPRRRAERVVELRHRRKGDRGLARVRVFGIDPGSERTGYGCVETDGRRHRLVLCGAIATSGAPTSRLGWPPFTTALAAQLRDCRPSVVAIESLFHAANVRSALKLGHARGVAMLAAVAGRRAGGRVLAVRGQARGGRLRPRRKGPGAADDQAAARARRARRRRTTPPTRWPWRSATCTGCPATWPRRLRRLAPDARR